MLRAADWLQEGLQTFMNTAINMTHNWYAFQSRPTALHNRHFLSWAGSEVLLVELDTCAERSSYCKETLWA